MHAVQPTFVPPRAKLRRGVAAILALCFLLEACTTNRTVAGPDMERVARVVRPGEEVRCTLHDGTEVSLEVTKVEAGVLVGATRQVAVKDIARIEVRRISPVRSAGMVLGVVMLGMAGATLGQAALFLALLPTPGPGTEKKASGPGK